MKAIKLITKSILTGLFLFLGTGLHAQDSMDATTNGNMKTILDNEKVTVIQVEYAPRQVTPMNYYPEHVAYVLSGGKMEMTEKGKEAKVMEINDGEAMYMPATTGMFKNVGTTTVKLVITEMKNSHKGMKGGKGETSMDGQKDSKSW